MKLRLIVSFISIFLMISLSTAAEQAILIKTVDKSSAKPGDIVTYCITYQNIGTATLGEVSILDVIPQHTIFQEAAGTDTTIYYCYDNSDNFGTTSTLPVTKVKWKINNPVQVGDRGMVSLRIKIR